MRTIYRVEDSEGNGPYGMMQIIWRRHHHFEPAHPSPFFDCDLMNLIGEWHQDDTLFGFKDLDQLKRWFHHPGEMKVLKELGFKVTIWEVKTIAEGCRQVVFLKEGAKKVGEVELPPGSMEFLKEEMS